MTEAEWRVVRPLLPVPAWLEGRGRRPEGHCHRVMLDAVRYVVDNGVKWVNLPADFRRIAVCMPSPRRWQATGLLAELHDRLRNRVREKGGRSPDPCVRDMAVTVVPIPPSGPTATGTCRTPVGPADRLITEALGSCYGGVGDSRCAWWLLVLVEELGRPAGDL
ncbi:transposase [Streptomyces sp. NPDC001939]